MNDRFRFRVWVTVSDKWLGDLTVPYMDYDRVTIQDGGILLYEWWDGSEEHGGEYVLMQCTGLKDKNGTLIYEGDIIECDGLSWEIFFEDALYYMGTKTKVAFSTRMFESMWAGISAVVGNIYENPELMVSNHA